MSAPPDLVSVRVSDLARTMPDGSYQLACINCGSFDPHDGCATRVRIVSDEEWTATRRDLRGTRGVI